MDTFFRANRVFAVAGASTNPAKFGYKVLKWYKDHNLPVVPINPNESSILGIDTVSDITKVPVPPNSDLVVSVVTGPAVTKKMIEDASNAQGKVDSLWMQPGTYDEEVLKLAREKIPNVITECVLVKGEAHLPSRL